MTSPRQRPFFKGLDSDNLSLKISREKMRRRRILYIVDSLGSGGAERQLVELVKGIDKKSYEPFIICLRSVSGGYTEELLRLGVQVAYAKKTSRYEIVRPARSLVRQIRYLKIDLVHTFLPMPSFLGCVAAWQCKKPCVASVIRDGKDKTRAERYCIRLVARMCDACVANSKAGLRSRFRVLTPKMCVIYNGVDFNRFVDENRRSFEKERMRRKFGLTCYGEVVGMVASLLDHKDHDTFLRAARIVVDKRRDVGFVLVGKGPRRQELEEYAKDLGIEKNVVFLGEQREVERLYCGMDVLVLLTNASKHLEGISNAVIEGMASSVPVVASAGGGTAEIVRDGITGLVVPPYDEAATAKAILGYFDGRVNTEEIVRAARLHVEEMFGLERYTAEYEAIYDELLAEVT